MTEKIIEIEREAKYSEISCDESASEVGEPMRRINYELTPSLQEKLKDLPEVMEYIEKLHSVIRKQIKKVQKWKTRIKKLNKHKDVSTQTESINYNHTNLKGDMKGLADDIKEAAEMAVQNSGFVYEETSGLYYDYNTGYYYNAEYGLYYDGTTGTYMKYNQETQSYEFHSQVQVTRLANQKESDKAKNVGKRKSKIGHNLKDFPKRQRGHEDSSPHTDIEEGECSESSDGCSDEDNKSDSSDISRQWPPCMRVIVESSDVAKVKVGSLHIITCDGGSLGREGDHSIVIPDINVSKHHLKFAFDKESGHYSVVDIGSRNGTILNNKRMAPSKQESDPIVIAHGSKIQIGSTVLLCHIHEGNHTCGHCEPGLVQFSKADEVRKINKQSRAEKHKSELRMLRKKCGIVNYEEDPKLASGYTDRAQKRRDTVGSQNPHEKTQTASLEESIPAENKGFKLLSKMGWKEGQSLGKDGQGMLEPISLTSNKGTTGIGCSEDITVEAVLPTEKQKLWKKTQERFQKLPDTTEIFEENSDE